MVGVDPTGSRWLCKVFLLHTEDHEEKNHGEYYGANHDSGYDRCRQANTPVSERVNILFKKVTHNILNK